MSSPTTLQAATDANREAFSEPSQEGPGTPPTNCRPETAALIYKNFAIEIFRQPTAKLHLGPFQLCGRKITQSPFRKTETWPPIGNIGGPLHP
jgi:hypothetical protein